ncbi:MAG: hypothetical protein M3O46_21725, partial [Myxococcota bacterium]|nr:hypothetical protein [Myxococcota bacterium]
PLTVPPPPPTASETATPPRRVVSLPLPGRGVTPRPTERAMTLHLQPTMGLKLSIDGETARDVSSGEVLRLDSKAHALTFSCEVCTPVQLPLAAGDKDDTLQASVPIKAATLIVKGDPDKTYQIVEIPELAVREGSNTVALKSMFKWITVRQMETDVRRRVRLEAGNDVPVSF